MGAFARLKFLILIYYVIFMFINITPVISYKVIITL
jgi:hypothetical protein